MGSEDGNKLMYEYFNLSNSYTYNNSNNTRVNHLNLTLMVVFNVSIYRLLEVNH